MPAFGKPSRKRKPMTFRHEHLYRHDGDGTLRVEASPVLDLNGCDIDAEYEDDRCEKCGHHGALRVGTGPRLCMTCRDKRQNPWLWTNLPKGA